MYLQATAVVEDGDDNSDQDAGMLPLAGRSAGGPEGCPSSRCAAVGLLTTALAGLGLLSRQFVDPQEPTLKPEAASSLVVSVSVAEDTGCANWQDILIGTETLTAESLEECQSLCAGFMGCVGFGFQKSECKEGVRRGACFLYSGMCLQEANSCWDYVEQTSSSVEEVALPEESSPSVSSNAGWSLSGSGQGCSNWASIKLQDFSGLNVEQCGAKCQDTPRCRTFNLETTTSCDGESAPTGVGTCNLYRQGCEMKADGCWDLYEMSSSAGYCEDTTPLQTAPRDPGELASWASSLVSQMTLEEKRNLVRGTGSGSYVGLTRAVPRLGIPSLSMQDGPQGFRTNDAALIGQVTSWPCSLAAAASWDTAAVQGWAAAMGSEFRAKGANVALGPGVNVNRFAKGGRNGEYLSGEDPYFGSRMAAAYVTGMQGAGVAAVVKHFVGNEQETDRMEVNVDIDERTLWEVYYPPFQAAIDAGVAAVMCSYNMVNGQHVCDSSKLLQEDLKSTMGFQGWVMSDWDAITTDGGAAAGADQDMGMTIPREHFSDAVLQTLTSERMDDMAQRVVTGMGRVWANDAFGCRADCNCDAPFRDAQATASVLSENRKMARDLAASAAVLLKNADGTLPLQKSAGTVAVLGGACFANHDPAALNPGDWLARDFYVVGGSGRVVASSAVSIAAGLEGSGMSLVKSITDDLDEAKKAMSSAQVAVVCGGATATESMDRARLDLHQAEYIEGVLSSAAELGLPTVVIALAPGPVVMPWKDQASAIVLMFLSGEQTGSAAADVMTGVVSPSGRLPVTIPMQDADTIHPCTLKSCEYSEGLLAGWHLYSNTAVAFPFGHGLSYTTFTYKVAAEWTLPNAAGARSLTVRVTNSGSVAGAEVLQLYLTFPHEAGEPEKLLRGFGKTKALSPGESGDVVFALTQRDVSTWSVAGHGWKAPDPTSEFKAMVGTSSQNLVLCGTFSAAAATPMAPCL